MNKFKYDPALPAEIKSELERFLNPLHWMVPLWCESVYIHWSDESKENAGIQCNTEYAYRWASLTFYPCWHTQDDTEKRKMVIHDLLHAFTCPLADYANDTIGRLLPEEESPKFRKHALDELRVRHESVVQDMALCIHRHLMPENP